MGMNNFLARERCSDIPSKKRPVYEIQPMGRVIPMNNRYFGNDSAIKNENEYFLSTGKGDQTFHQKTSSI